MSLGWILLVSTAMFGRTVTLTWTDTDTGVTFNVYRGAGICSSNPAFSFIASGIVPTTYADTITVDGTYCYYVTAVDTASMVQSGPSNKVNAVVGPHIPVLKTPVITGFVRLVRRLVAA